MYKRYIFYPFLLVFNVFLVHGQQNIFGKITDTLGQTIKNASILLSYNLNNNLETRFTLVNQDGSYSLIIPRESLNPSLQCIALGYKTQTISLQPAKSNYNFVLVPSTVFLKPVNITEKQPVKLKNDTTNFLADAYSKKNEQTVEDLIKRLPGIDVDKEGNIKYNGKNIERVLIEGDDLFETNFKMLTKNLSADVVEKIQTIENYNDNPLIAGLGKTDKQILNLQLKKDRLLNINGNVDVNVGMPLSKFEGKLNLISITPNLKGLVLGGVNNVGSNPFTILSVAPPNSQQRFFNLEGNIPIQTNPLLVSLPYLYYNGIDINRNNFNNAKIGSANFMVKPTKKIELKLMTYLVSDNNRQIQNTNTSFSVDNLPTIFFNETNSLAKRQLYQSHNLSFSYRPNKSQQIKYSAKLNNNSTKQQSFSKLITNHLQQNLDENSVNTEQRIEYTNRLGKETALDIEFLYYYSQNPQNFVVNPYNYYEFFPPQATSNEIVYQDANTSLNQFSVNGRVISKLYKQVITFNTGYNYTQRNFNTLLYTLANYKKKINDFGGQYDNLIQNLYFDGSYDLELSKKLFLTINTTYTIEQYNLEDLAENTRLINETYNYLKNKLTLKFKTETSGTVNLQYSNNLNIPGLTDILPVYWLSDYKTFSRGAGSFVKRNNNAYSINYSIADYYTSRLLVYSGFIYNTNSPNYINNLQFTSFYQIISKNTTSNFYPHYIAYARVEKYIDPLKGNFSVDLNSIWTKLESVSNSMENLIEINSTTLKTGYKSGFKGFLSFDLSTTLRLNRQSITTLDKYASSTKNFENRFALYLTPNDNFSIELDAEQYILPVNTTHKSLLFFDIKARYQPKNKNWTFNLSALNILNNKYLSFDTLAQSQFRTQTFNLVPHIFMIGAYHRFTL